MLSAEFDKCIRNKERLNEEPGISASWCERLAANFVGRRKHSESVTARCCVNDGKSYDCQSCIPNSMAR